MDFSISMRYIMYELLAELTNFIRGLFPENDIISLHEPSFEGREREYVLDAINSGFVSSVGPYVDRFEDMIAEYTGAVRAVATVNGTAALHAALHLLGVHTGDLVVTQPLTFVATSNAIRYCGATPVFVDVDEDTLGLSPMAVQRFFSSSCRRDAEGTIEHKSGRRVAACVPMHTFGFPMRIEELTEVCGEWGVPIVEDAAESLGSYVGVTHTGLFGTIGILSFNGNKTITCGGGGMIITNSEVIGERAKHITTTAKLPHEWEYVHDELGFNYRLPNINAALGCAQMETLEAKLQRKRELARRYQEFFSDFKWSTAGYNVVMECPGTKANYWLNAVRCPNRNARDELLRYTHKNEVMTRPAWELMYRLPLNSPSVCCDCPVAENAVDRIVNLPSSALSVRNVSRA
jgi:aminotransferase in exopolysaccharide biosynthesis